MNTVITDQFQLYRTVVSQDNWS